MINYHSGYNLCQVKEFVNQNIKYWQSYLQKFENHNSGQHDNFFLESVIAYLKLAERLTRYYSKPDFENRTTIIDGKEIKIKQHTIQEYSFCNLMRFKKVNYTKQQPKLLLIAPLSGHYATLLKGTLGSVFTSF